MARSSDTDDDATAPEPKASGGTSGSAGGSPPVSPGSGGIPPGTGGTAPAVGGSGGIGPGNGSGGTPASSDFELLWEDNFDSFDEARWSKATHTFPENLAGFTPENAFVEGGLLKLRVTAQQRGDKPYSAAEIYSNDTFLYGRFEARIRFASGSGIVSSLFIYNYDPWNEIDIESLGHQLQGVQYNIITGTPGGGLTYQPHFDPIGFSPYADFHDYAFEWRPGDVRFFVDGQPRHTDARNASRLNQQVRLRMNCWPTNNEVTNFAGPLNPNAIPTEAHYDWVRVYRYVP
jgi:beta-glucanase (GH16 family)